MMSLYPDTKIQIWTKVCGECGCRYEMHILTLYVEHTDVLQCMMERISYLL